MVQRNRALAIVLPRVIPEKESRRSLPSPTTLNPKNGKIEQASFALFWNSTIFQHLKGFLVEKPLGCAAGVKVSGWGQDAVLCYLVMGLDFC